MISHSLITIAWMLSGFAWRLVLRLGPTAGAIFLAGWTGFIIGVWYSREEMQEEYHLDRVGRANPQTLLPFLWDKWNQDFVVPVAIALVMAAAFMLWRPPWGRS